MGVPIPEDEVIHLRAEVESLRAQVAMLTRQKEYYIRELERVLKTWMPVPPSEEEILAAKPNGEELTKLIAELESR